MMLQHDVYGLMREITAMSHDVPFGRGLRCVRAFGLSAADGPGAQVTCFKPLLNMNSGL